MSDAADALRRTQIYLTRREHEALGSLSVRTGKNRSELIREAVDRLVSEAGEDSRHARLSAARGLWAGRDDLPDFEALRRELDRPLRARR